MSGDRERWQRGFDRANTRLSELTVEHCKHIELSAARGIRVLGPRPPMLKTLIATMEAEPPSEAFRERAHHTLRRFFARMRKRGLDYSVFETASNAFLDGQRELLEEHLSLDLYLRPWGER